MSPGMVVRAVNPDGTPIAGGGGTTGTPVVTAPANYSALVATGSATAPTAGTNIATLAAPTAGTYEVQVWVAVSGTATTAAADSNNMNVKAGAGTLAALLPYNCSTAGNLTNPGPFIFQEIMNGATNLTVNAVANATAGTVYSAMIIATRVA
jgi:hypothetical protein